jgi:hypothetical protein
MKLKEVLEPTLKWSRGPKGSPESPRYFDNERLAICVRIVGGLETDPRRCLENRKQDVASAGGESYPGYGAQLRIGGLLRFARSDSG